MELPAKTHRMLSDLIFESLLRMNFRSMKTGIVFAGFGENEFMPAYITYEVEGVIGNRLRYFRANEMQISSKIPSHIDGFGQREAMDAFTDGVSREFRWHMIGVLDDFVSEMKDVFVRISGKKYTAHQAKQLDRILQKKQDGLFEKWMQGARNSWLPIYKMVEPQPKDELAATAEELVNLTKFRLRVNPGEETVGGPIDVAIITKGDGFVWVKKKQYYPAELNPHKTGPA